MRLATPIAISLLLTGAALADENSDAVPMGSQPIPVSTGRPHVCTQYPDTALSDRAEGETELRFTVTKDGSVKDVTVSKSSGNSALDDAAVTCAARWKYKPLPMDVNHGGSVYWRLPH